VMRQVSCFYCNSDDSYNISTIIYMFGIKSCDKHLHWAKRDCKAFMHRLNIVSILDLEIIFAEFFEKINSDTFIIQRTSGIMETGWKINVGTTFEPTFMKRCIVKDKTKEWTVPLYKNIDNKFIHKECFISEIQLWNPSILVDSIRKHLDAGIYKQFELSYQAAVDPENSIVKDPSYINTGILNGNTVRFLVPDPNIIVNDEKGPENPM